MKERRRNSPSRILACMLCIIMLISALTGCQVPEDPTQGSSFPTTLPEPTDKPTEPTSPTPTETAPTEPRPTAPAPTEPAPTEPAPTEPAPTEPAPTEPAPTDPIPDYSWLIGTWNSAVRYDEPDSMSTLSLLSITFHANGQGSINDDGLTNFDIITGSFLDHWASPGDMAFTSEEFTYAIEGGKLAITFVYHEYVSYEPFTVYFPLPELHNGMITLADSEGNIQDSALGGSLIDRTFVKGPISVEDLCAVLGVDYTVPPVGGGDQDTIPQWLIGSWETAWRDDANQDGQPYLITSGYVFLEDGTGYTLGHEYWAWDMENGRPGDAWESVPMGYPSTSFIYSVSGDQLTISYTGDDFEEYQPPYPTDVMTLIHNADGSITLKPDGRTYVHNAVSPEQLCAMLGVDYSLPQIEESPYTQQLLQDSWHTTIRNDLGKGFAELRTYSIEFDNDGTGYYHLSSHLMNRSRGELSSAWNKQSINSREYIPFRYTLSGDMLYVTMEDGRRTEYSINISGQIMELTDQRNGDILRFATGSSFHYIDKLCELIGVSYDSAHMVYTENLVGILQTMWRDDTANAYATLYQASFRFNADGTGEFTRQGYIAWDLAQNCALDHWVADPTLSHTCSFTYSLNRFEISLSFTCGDPGCCSGSYILYYYQNESIYLHAPEGVAALPFDQLIRSEKSISQEELCAILGVTYAVDPNKGQTAVSKKALHGIWKTASRSFDTVSIWSYTFREDGTGEYCIQDWRCRDDYGHALGKWEADPSTSTPVSFVYTLQGNTLTIKASLYRDHVTIYTYTLARLSDGTLLMIPEFDDHTKFVYGNPDPTLEQLCAALGVDLTLSQ